MVRLGAVAQRFKKCARRGGAILKKWRSPSTVSDHFLTFLQLPQICLKLLNVEIFPKLNVDRFGECLGNLSCLHDGYMNVLPCFREAEEKNDIIGQV